jgi:hypothetical protein
MTIADSARARKKRLSIEEEREWGVGNGEWGIDRSLGTSRGR